MLPPPIQCLEARLHSCFFDCPSRHKRIRLAPVLSDRQLLPRGIQGRYLRLSLLSPPSTHDAWFQDGEILVLERGGQSLSGFSKGFRFAIYVELPVGRATTRKKRRIRGGSTSATRRLCRPAR